MKAKSQKYVPAGIDIIHRTAGHRLSYGFHRFLVLFITFLCYTGYHATRKPPSVVKSVLRGDSTFKFLQAKEQVTPVSGWAPFNGVNGESLLGGVDLAFLGTYALGMFFSGHICDRVDLRTFLTAGMLGSGVFVTLYGLGYFAGCHSFVYYVLVSVAAGLFQSTGWPSVVSAVANWCGKGKRGLVMGIWNVHTSLGNILGSIVAAAALSRGWGWSFVVPGVLLIALAFLVHFFLLGHPEEIGYSTPGSGSGNADVEHELEELQPLKGDLPAPGPPLNGHRSSGGGIGRRISGDAEDQSSRSSFCYLSAAASAAAPAPHGTVRFIDAWRIPGVASFAFCLFFSKLVAYTFLYWLPFYIRAAPIAERMLSAKEAGELSVFFDVGGVAGGIMAGYLSDRSGASAAVACSFTLLSAPCLYLYRTLGRTSAGTNALLLVASGFFVNGPYALITTSVSADLGTHESLQGSATALATVSAIIDGMGSIGAALGPLLTGLISSSDGGFDRVFIMLYLSAAAAGALLVRLVAKDVAAFRERAIRKDVL